MIDADTIAQLLDADPACNGRVTVDTIEAIAALPWSPPEPLTIATSRGKQVLLDGAHYADARSIDAAEAIASALNLCYAVEAQRQ